MPSERRWVILAQDGRHVTMGRAAPPSEAEVEAAAAALLVVRSLLSAPDSSVNRPAKTKASGARRECRVGNGLHESHH